MIDVNRQITITKVVNGWILYYPSEEFNDRYVFTTFSDLQFFLSMENMRSNSQGDCGCKDKASRIDIDFKDIFKDLDTEEVKEHFKAGATEAVGFIKEMKDSLGFLFPKKQAKEGMEDTEKPDTNQTKEGTEKPKATSDKKGN